MRYLTSRDAPDVRPVVCRVVRRFAAISLISLICLLSGLPSSLGPAPATSQERDAEAGAAGADVVKLGGSPSVRRLGHLDLGEPWTVGGVDVEQDPARPYVYVRRWQDRSGFQVVDVSDPRRPEVVYTWRSENADAYEFGFGETGKHFMVDGRHYYAGAISANREGVDSDLCLVVFDVTGLPDPSRVEEVARVRDPETARGCVHVFPYAHSDGRVLLFASPSFRRDTAGSLHASVYDARRLVEGAADFGRIGRVPLPDVPLRRPGEVDGPVPSMVDRGYHDLYVAYDPGRRRDTFYGAGTNGFHLYDVSVPEEPAYLGSISQSFGVQRGHTIQATPDARYAVTQTEHMHSPAMIWDVRPILDGETDHLATHAPLPVGSWIADWRNVAHNFELRWPFVFVAAYEDGLQVFDMTRPESPRTVGWYYTCMCAHRTGYDGLRFRGTGVQNGAVELDVRNEDGLIVVSDLRTGLWTFRMEGFDGWDGEDYGVPDISSAQRWGTRPPEGS